MKYLLFLSFLIIMASCRSGYISQLESEVDSLQMAVDSLSEAAILHKKLAERNEKLAVESANVAQMAYELARERSLMATERVNDLKDSLNKSGMYIRINRINYDLDPAHSEYIYSIADFLDSRSIRIYPDPEHTDMNVVGFESYDLVKGQTKKTLPADISREDIIIEIEEFFEISISN